MYWSLRNKTEDVERALVQSDSQRARMAALELGVRFSTTAASPSQAGEVAFGRRGNSDLGAVKVLSMFGQELSRLLAFLKQHEPAHAAEVVQLLINHLDTLDKKSDT